MFVCIKKRKNTYQHKNHQTEMTINLYLITGNTRAELFKKKRMDLLRGDRMLGNYTHMYHNLYKFVNISEINR